MRKEEKEREERRKRVEAIMSRTRKGGGTPGNTPNKVRVLLENKKKILTIFRLPSIAGWQCRSNESVK